jgi:RNA-directed DNA polymerase
LILLRDGSADHMGKGWAGSQRGQSTDTRGRNAPKRSVSSTLSALSRKAASAPKHRFRALYRLIDLQMLYESFRALKRRAAPGVDGVTVRAYEKNLDENLRSLLKRLIGKRYRALPVRRRYIEKPGSSKLRPLGIPALEDKIVQHAASRILESVYEEDFSERSVGYRRGKPGARQCSYQLARELYSGTYRWVAEADVRSFFDDFDHKWLVRMLEQRIADRAFVGLIVKWLKAGVLEAEGESLQPSEAGTPQGGIISPILANIYLHYVLDIWLEQKLCREFRGRYLFMRYADDFVVCFEWQCDADNFLRQLGGRLGKFSLRLAEEKSGLVKFNRWQPEDSGKFTFLGFDFYWERSCRNRNHLVVKRKTAKKKFRAALASLKTWIIEHRHRPLRWVLERLRSKFLGHWNYYGVIGNSLMLRRYFYAATKLVFKWLNRRSQRRSFTWRQFSGHWRGDWRIPAPRVVELNESRSQRQIQSTFAMS